MTIDFTAAHLISFLGNEGLTGRCWSLASSEGGWWFLGKIGSPAPSSLVPQKEIQMNITIPPIILEGAILDTFMEKLDEINQLNPFYYVTPQEFVISILNEAMEKDNEPATHLSGPGWLALGL